VRILHTNPDITDDEDINNSSIVLWMKYGKKSFLFMGDGDGKEDPDSAEVFEYVENYLHETYDASVLNCDVLKVAHHGSKTSSTSSFIEAVQPDHAIICAGCDHNLPKDTIIQRYEDICPEIVIWRTDKEDTSKTTAPNDDHILIKSDGKEVYPDYVAVE
jgi:competence protein ComEC